MTINDAMVIGFGSFFLLVVFAIIGWIQAHGALDGWAIIRRYVVVRIADMSSEDLAQEQFGTGSDATGTGSLAPVPGQQHQVEPDLLTNLEPDEKAFARQLAREELIITLAVQRNENGDYLFSANQITSFVGGAAAPVKSTIANVRGKKETPPPARSIARPPDGWPAH